MPDPMDLTRLQLELTHLDIAIDGLRIARNENASREVRAPLRSDIAKAVARIKNLARKGIDNLIAPLAGTNPGQWMLATLNEVDEVARLSHLWADPDFDQLDCSKEEKRLVKLRRSLVGRGRVLRNLPTILENMPPGSAAALTESDKREGHQKAKKKRGRPSSSNAIQDARYWDAWHTDSYRDYADLAKEFKVPKKEVVKALDRERKRRARANQ